MKYAKYLAIVVLGLLPVSCNTPNRIVSEGSRVGVVTKFSLKETGGSVGLPGPKSWEGVLNMTIPGTAVQEQWLFSVPPDDEAAVKKVKEAMRSRSTVELAYRQWLSVPVEISGCSQLPKQGTNYAVYDVLPIADANR